MIKITTKFTKADVRKMIQQKLDRIYAAAITRLKFIGEAFIRDARNNGTYKDVTGNLRSSIGYMIFRDGVLLEEAFPGQTATGKAAGRKVAEDAIKGLPYNGLALVCVAGMHYALQVEANGKDVITASSITAKNAFKKAMASLNEKIPTI